MLFAVRSATALHRLLDVLPVFAGDDRIQRLFTLVPGSDFDVQALAAIEHTRARTIPWATARRRSFDLILAASPKGELRLLRGPRVLLPHGAGFNKTVDQEGSYGLPSGLDPTHLLSDGHAMATLHALAHPSQVARLAAHCPPAATHAAVVGDPTLDRILESRAHRDGYRAALGTGGRKLIVLTSTWGPESLLARRPDLPARLASQLPHDDYQSALILHPNEHSRIGTFDLSQQLAPALDAGMILARPYEDWGAVLIAADAVITDHGSTALYAAALDRPLIVACDGGAELIPGSPMAKLLAHSPRLVGPERLEAALQAHRPGTVHALAQSAFAEQGRALERLRKELYGRLGLTPPPGPVDIRPLPKPSPPAREPTAFAIRTHISGNEVHVERFPAHLGAPAQHLAAEYGTAGERQLQSAALLYLRARSRPAAAHGASWTATGWTARVLAEYPACRLAAAVLTPALCVARTHRGTLLSVHIEPWVQQNGRVLTADPAAVLSAVHTWLSTDSELPSTLVCVTGGRPFRVRLRTAEADEAGQQVY